MDVWRGVTVIALVLSSDLLAISGNRQKMISTPDKPTKVYVGENVSLVWRYYQPADVTLFEVVFGYWKSSGYLDPKLIAVDSNGVPSIRAGYESAIAWAGNLTSSLAVFVLYNVQPADGNVDFGIQVEFGLAHSPLTDIVRLQVEAKLLPSSPKILNTNVIARNASWTLRWSEIYSEGRLVTLYTVWHRILLRVAEDNITRKELWSRENVTGFTYHKELAANTRYMFAVTAWNKWGESGFDSDKIFIVSTDFTGGNKTTILLQTISSEPGTLISPASKSTKKDEKRKNVIITVMLTTIALFSLLVVGTCCLRKKFICKKERNIDK